MCLTTATYNREGGLYTYILKIRFTTVPFVKHPLRLVFVQA